MAEGMGCPAERKWIPRYADITLRCDLLVGHDRMVTTPPHDPAINQKRHRTTIDDTMTIYWE